METIIYLKQNTLGANGVKSYNQNNLTSIDYFECGGDISCSCEKYDDLEDLQDSFSRDLGIEKFYYSISDRETFNKVAIEFGKLHNLIISEL